MRRRGFIAALGGVAVAWPLAARAQQLKPEIGFINAASAQNYARELEAFLKGLGETGYVDDRNVAIQYRWAEVFKRKSLLSRRKGQEGPE